MVIRGSFVVWGSLEGDDGFGIRSDSFDIIVGLGGDPEILAGDNGL